MASLKNSVELKEYVEYIRGLAQNNKDVVFYNSGEHHAALVMSTIFDNSKDVRIYAGCFSGEISGQDEYRNSLENFLGRGGKLKVLLEKNKLEERKEEPKIFDILRFYSIVKPGSVQIKKHSNLLVKQDKTKNGEEINEVHFTVADGKMYRVEDNINSFSAFGNFNDKKFSEDLIAIFDKIFGDEKSSEPINLLTKT